MNMGTLKDIAKTIILAYPVIYLKMSLSFNHSLYMTDRKYTVKYALFKIILLYIYLLLYIPFHIMLYCTVVFLCEHIAKIVITFMHSVLCLFILCLTLHLFFPKKNTVIELWLQHVSNYDDIIR